MIYNIHLLRFTSALGVMIAHLIMWGNRKYYLDLPSWDSYAAYLTIGVDIFFLISGFVMIYTSGQNTTSFKDFKKRSIDFLYKRIVRIYPVWWLFLILLLPIYFFKPELISSDPDNSLSFIKSFFLIPHEGKPLLAVGWTLEFEMLFYLLFGGSIFLSRYKQCIALSLLMILAVIAGLKFDLPNPFWELMTSSILLYFPMGMAFGLIYSNINYSLFKLLLVAFAIIFSAFHTLEYSVGDIDRFIHFSPMAISVFCFFVFLEKGNMIISKKFYKWGGDISYALYLIHLIIIAIIGKISILLGLFPILGTPLILVIMFVSSIVGATIVYYMFERPVLRRLRKSYATQE